MVGRIVPTGLNEDDVRLFFSSAARVFHDEPGKYDELIKVFKDYENHRHDLATLIAKVEELLKNHRDLFVAFYDILPLDGSKRPISPERFAKSYYTKRNRVDAENFMNKLKTRFWSIDTHVVGSFRKILNRFKEGEMSGNKAYDKVIDILYYHEDLINEFSRLFTKSDPVATSSLLLQARFQGDDIYVYKSFVDNLTMLGNGSKSAIDVHHQICLLFRDHPDLLEEFNRFQPARPVRDQETAILFQSLHI